MKNIIKKAIEGGYEPFKSTKMKVLGMEIIESTVLGGEFLVNIGKGMPYRASVNGMVLDPLFWQALGKACGWGEYPDYKIEVPMFFTEMIQIAPAIQQKRYGYKLEKHSPYIYYAVWFHQINLTEGFEKAVEWLEEIIK